MLESGITHVAIVFIHSYTFHDHEIAVGKLCEEVGFKHVSLSSELMPMVKMVQRGHTATVDAFLTPLIRRYVDDFISGFDEDFINNVELSFMMSDGGLCPINNVLNFNVLNSSSLVLKRYCPVLQLV